MDNRVFNVNGSSKEMLRSALNLVFEQQGEKTTADGWAFSKKHGLILLWYEDNGINMFPSPMTDDECLPMVWTWLKSKQAGEVELDDWDKDADHDGHNSKGWRVYCEDWGHVGEYHGSICAIKSVFLWHGK